MTVFCIFLCSNNVLAEQNVLIDTIKPLNNSENAVVNSLNIDSAIIEYRDEGNIKNWTLYKNPESRSSQYFNEPTGIWIKNGTDIESVVNCALSNSNGDAIIFVIYFNPLKNGLDVSNIDIKGYIQDNITIANQIATNKSIIVLEPDMLCLNINNQDNLNVANRIMKSLVSIYKTICKNAKVYIDAGHSNWLKEEVISNLLLNSGIERSDGFSTNVGNFQSTKNELIYAQKISELTGHKRFIIDTSRNGRPLQKNNQCVYDPPGILTGIKPTIEVNESGLDAYLWIKPPGEADGRLAPAGSWYIDNFKNIDIIDD